MPKFHIEDSGTGIKLLVDGPTPPSEDEAAALVNEELQFLSTNVYRAPNNKFLLDVGPLQAHRRFSDSVSKTGSIQPWMHNQELKYNRIKQAIKNAKQRIDTIINQRGDVGDNIHDTFQQFFDQELASLPMPELLPETDTSITEKTMDKLPNNSLLIVSHGSPTGGLVSEGGHSFTLLNLATVLGQRSNDVHNIINTACYGGKLCAPDYQSAFPNATNIQHADLSMPNMISLNHLAEGKYFYTNTVPGVWERVGTNWQDKPKTINRVFNNGDDE